MTKEEKAEKRRNYLSLNKERFREYARVYNLKNKERISKYKKDYFKKWYLCHKNEKNASSRDWYAKNKKPVIRIRRLKRDIMQKDTVKITPTYCKKCDNCQRERRRILVRNYYYKNLEKRRAYGRAYSKKRYEEKEVTKVIPVSGWHR